MRGWHVWGELRRRPHITLEWAFLAGLRGEITDEGRGRRTITLDARLGRRDRRAVLAHELVHDDRGILYDDTIPAALVEKEEALVQAEAVRRLVPIDELSELVESRVHDGEAVEWPDVADWFDVPQHVAEHALRMLQQCERT